jgi:hypothetical protein
LLIHRLWLRSRKQGQQQQQLQQLQQDEPKQQEVQPPAAAANASPSTIESAPVSHETVPLTPPLADFV